MEIVKTVKRINALNEAMKKINTCELWKKHEKYDDVYDKIYEKKEMLANALKSYKTASFDRKIRIQRHKNLKLACRLLKVDYYSVIR